MRNLILKAALAGLLVVGAALPVAAQGFEIRVGENPVTFTSQPIAVGANILVPLRESLTAVGATDIRYIPATNQVTFAHEGRQVSLDLRQNRAMVGGTQMAIPIPTRNINGRIFVRSDFVQSLDPDFSVTRVAGFRGAQFDPATAPIPEGSGIQSFSVGGQGFSYSSPTWFMGESRQTLMVPLNETLTAMGIGGLDFQTDLQAGFDFRGTSVLLNYMSGYAYIGSVAVPLDAPVVVRDNIVYVPSSFFTRLDPSFTIPGLAG